VLQYVAVCCSACVRVGEGEENLEQNPLNFDAQSVGVQQKVVCVCVVYVCVCVCVCV